MNFQITQISNPESFCKAIDRCKGDVLLITSEGTCLNLKSKLCQLIALNNVLGGVSQLHDIVLHIENPTDVEILLSYVAGESQRAVA